MGPAKSATPNMIEGQRKGVLLIGTWLSGYVQGPVRKQRAQTGDVGPASVRRGTTQTRKACWVLRLPSIMLGVADSAGPTDLELNLRRDWPQGPWAQPSLPPPTWSRANTLNWC